MHNNNNTLKPRFQYTTTSQSKNALGATSKAKSRIHYKHPASGWQ